MKLINEAIVKYPNEPMGYVKRAELTSNAAESIGDAIADLDTAIRLKPDLWNALQLRALLKIRTNRQDEAMDDLTAVVKGNPGAEGPRTALLQALIEADKFEQARDIANFAANQRPRDVALLMNLGDLFNSYASQKPEAMAASLRFYDLAW
jgi:tetratricopeptide (TPR) repeat protein